MTTVAYRNHVLVSDSQQSIGGHIISGVARKLWRSPSGSVFASVGSAAKCARLIKGIENGVADYAVFRYDDGAVIEMSATALIYHASDGPLELDPDHFYAYGSGATAALGAMHMGATAQQAVRIAAKVDPATNSRLMVFKRPRPSEVA